MKKIKCLIFIDADVIFRHFVLSGSFEQLIKKQKVQYVLPEKGNKRLGDINLGSIDKLIIKNRIDHNPKRLKIWRQLLFVDQLRFKNGLQNKSMRSYRKKTLKWKAATLFTIFGLPIIWKIFKLFKLLQLNFCQNQQMIKVIENFKPDVIIHPSVLEGLFINDLILISKKKKIPLVVIMNSWDNPSTKNSVIGFPDWLLVWGRQTYEHSIKYMQMEKSRVIEFGCAQFDIFKCKTINNYNFRKKYNIKYKKIIILYAGSSKGTNEIHHLDLINKAIVDKKIENIKIIYRPHPWGQGGIGVTN